MNIPLSESKTVTWADPDSGAVFEYRPLVGEKEIEVYSLYDRLQVDASPYYVAAESAVDALSRGKRWGKGERERTIDEKARELAKQAKGASFNPDEIRACYQIVNEMCVGWQHPSWPPRNPEKAITEHFRLEDNIKIFTGFAEANGLSGEEAKN